MLSAELGAERAGGLRLADLRLASGLVESGVGSCGMARVGRWCRWTLHSVMAAWRVAWSGAG